MPLLSASDLSGPLTPEQALARAEALVAAALCPGLPDLSVRTWQAEYRMRNDQRALGIPLYGRRRLGPEVLRYWPITGLTSVSQDGVNLTAECVFDTFSIRRDALSAEFMALGVVTVVFQTGWIAADLPDSIRQAILLTARDLTARPESVAAEKLGDASTTYVQWGSRALPAPALQLLAPWRFGVA